MNKYKVNLYHLKILFLKIKKNRPNISENKLDLKQPEESKPLVKV
jgi:hypothetical protein